MLHECDERRGGACTGNSTEYNGIQLIFAGAHCHTPSCISLELFNSDTGQLLCKNEPVYGQSDEVKIKKIICIWFSMKGIIYFDFFSRYLMKKGIWQFHHVYGDLKLKA